MHLALHLRPQGLFELQSLKSSTLVTLFFQDEHRLGAANVKHLVAVDGLPLAIIDHFSVASKNVQQGTVDAVVNGSCKIVRASTILVACTYRRRANGMIQILVPIIFRDSIE